MSTLTIVSSFRCFALVLFSLSLSLPLLSRSSCVKQVAKAYQQSRRARLIALKHLHFQCVSSFRALFGLRCCCCCASFLSSLCARYSPRSYIVFNRCECSITALVTHHLQVAANALPWCNLSERNTVFGETNNFLWDKWTHSVRIEMHWRKKCSSMCEMLKTLEQILFKMKCDAQVNVVFLFLSSFILWSTLLFRPNNIT